MPELIEVEQNELGHLFVWMIKVVYPGHTTDYKAVCCNRADAIASLDCDVRSIRGRGLTPGQLRRAETCVSKFSASYYRGDELWQHTLYRVPLFPPGVKERLAAL